MIERLKANWKWTLFDLGILAVAVFVGVRYVIPWLTAPRPLDPEALRASGPSTDEEWEAALTASITAGGDYLAAHQLSNGELPYTVHVTAGSQTDATVFIRLIAGAGALYTVCDVTGDEGYCQTGDRALAHYLDQLVEPVDAPGLCFYDSGMCTLGGNSIAIDAIYRRWRATDSTSLNGTDLLETALQAGENIAWMRREDGDLIYALDPFTGKPDLSAYDRFYSGESLLALLELFEMTGDPRWLEQARLTNAYKLGQEPTTDHWHAYGMSMFARLDELHEEDVARARQIGESALQDLKALTEETNAVTVASTVEALANVGLAFAQTGEDYAWLEPGLEAYSAFVLSHQLPNHTCDWAENLDLARYAGGIYGTCEEPFMRVDGVQHWVNGAAAYLALLQQTD